MAIQVTHARTHVEYDIVYALPHSIGLQLNYNIFFLNIYQVEFLWHFYDVLHCTMHNAHRLSH